MGTESYLKMAFLFDADRFARDHSIRIAGADDKHHAPGWVNIACPFCSGNPGFHLGYDGNGDYWNCYRCGFHSMAEVVRELLDVSWTEARQITERYGGRPKGRGQKEEKDRRPTVTLPAGCSPLAEQHKAYLARRGFNPEALAEEWGLVGTGPIGPYKFRIIAPIMIGGRMVSYQGRDITGRATAKYKACAKTDEATDHKNVLYGMDKALGHSVVVVEGVTDVWRLGPGAVATFGVKWTLTQMALLRRWARIVVMFDAGEMEARVQARKLAMALASFGCSVELARPRKGDPADMDPIEAANFMRQIRGF